MRRNTRYLASAGTGLAVLGLGAYLWFNENSADIELDKTQTPLSRTESQHSKGPSLFDNEIQSSRPKLEERLETSHMDNPKTSRSLYETLRETMLHTSVNELYTFKGFSEKIGYLLDAGEKVTLGELRSLANNSGMRPQLAELFGDTAHFLMYVRSFGDAPDEETIGKYLQKRHLLPVRDIDGRIRSLWLENGEKIWNEYREQTFLPHVFANIPGFKGNNVIPENLTLKQIIPPLLAIHESDGKVYFSQEQKKTLKDALDEYDSAERNIRKITPEDYEKDPTEYDRLKKELNLLEWSVSKALMPHGEFDIHNRVASGFDRNGLKSIGDLMRIGYWKRVLGQ